MIETSIEKPTPEDKSWGSEFSVRLAPLLPPAPMFFLLGFPSWDQAESKNQTVGSGFTMC